MKLLYPIQRFIEDNINLLEEGKLAEFLYQSMFALTSSHTRTLFHDVLKEIYSEEQLLSQLQDAYTYWFQDHSLLQVKESRIRLSSLIKEISSFGLPYPEFELMIVNALKKACPNKTIVADSFGIEWVQEK